MSTGKFWFSLILPDENEPVPDDGHGDGVENGSGTARRGENEPEGRPAEQDTVSTETTE